MAPSLTSGKSGPMSPGDDNQTSRTYRECTGKKRGVSSLSLGGPLCCLDVSQSTHGACSCLHGPQVFQWFSDDFTKKVGKASVLDSLLPYMPDDIQKYVSEKKSTLKIEYFDYDWGVNGISPGKPGK